MPTTSIAASFLLVAALILYGLLLGLPPLLGFIACAAGISGLHRLFTTHPALSPAGA